MERAPGALRQAVPQFFGKERHHGMQQTQRRIERGENIAPRRERDLAIGCGELRLHPLDIPVAEIAPEEVVNRLAGFVEAEILERLVRPAP